MTSSTECDFLVVGGGLAGLTAAVRAAELGLHAVVLEQGDGEAYPCNSRYSGGILHLAFRDPYRPAEELIGFVQQATGGSADEQLVTAVSQSAKRLIDWLQGHGARFMRFNPQEAYRWCLAPPRALRAGIDWKERGPDLTLRRLATRLNERGGRVQLRTRATALRMQDGVCVGLIAETDAGHQEWTARHVLLADGGFQADRALFEEHIGARFDGVFQRGARTGRGSGLRMAVEAGAALTETNRFYGHLLCRDAFENDNVWPYPELDAIATAGIVVDGSGQRLADEGRGGVYLTNMLAGLSDRAPFFAIFDAAIWDGPGKSARIPANPLLEQAGGTIVRANDLPGLARAIGVPEEALSESVAAYNAALERGSLESLPVPRSTTIKPAPIMQAPFMAIPASPGITYTMGGIAIDARAHVLRKDGSRIPGLFAAGATTGGLEGGPNATYLGGLMKAGVFGLLAAERAAELQGVAVNDVASAPAGRQAVAGHTSAPAAETSAPSPYPVLQGIVRYGFAGAIALSLGVTLLAIWLCWPLIGIAAIPVGLIAGAVCAVVALSYVELVKLITQMLSP